MHDSFLATGVIFIIIVIVPYSLVYINLYELMKEMFRSLAAVRKCSDPWRRLVLLGVIPSQPNLILLVSYL